ncbi:hypothetical protein BMA721280_C0181 [Burkholderia mallei 2002721280]|uniref:Uncharacterized protein n=4 Tax=pseudomallei group TaxID=111527 RepID=Q3JVJ7_BURP1|nr:hypothetical protein BURPS1710b_0994 [Burkholderia pseudomallei 1710b]EDK87314.1 hypothetical protein BMA721280_C0181 [Burkholderia mallei 2002721280]EDP87747.1 hypothetical protein BMA10399_I0234 [Burkholderia mallei ATCC 10399]
MMKEGGSTRAGCRAGRLARPAGFARRGPRGARAKKFRKGPF